MAAPKNDLPLGFAMSLAQNAPALEHFGALSQEEQNRWIARAHSIRSKSEMEQLVSQLSERRG